MSNMRVSHQSLARDPKEDRNFSNLAEYRVHARVAQSQS